MAHAPRLVSEEIQLASWAKTIKRSALQDMLVKASRPGIISFALGLPAPELFPKDDLAQAAARVLATQERALQYEPPIQKLKQQIVMLMRERGVNCRPEQVFLTVGAQQGMSLLARLLLNPGGQILVEEMTYTGFRQAIEPFEPHVLTVPTDAETGIDVEAVERLLSGGARPAYLYVITDGHNPLSVSVSAAKRARLVELARYFQVPIVEDDAYGFLHYEDAATPPMRALDDQGVFYVGSFSKILAPSLRAGWLVVPEPLTYKLSIVKEASDIDTTTFTQRVISAYLDEGLIADHLTKLRSEYATRRDMMLRSLSEHFPDEARWHRPTNGVFIWVELPPAINATELLEIAIEQEGVAFIPGVAFSMNSQSKASHCMRLNFSNSSSGRIQDGIARLARALERLI